MFPVECAETAETAETPHFGAELQLKWLQFVPKWPKRGHLGALSAPHYAGMGVAPPFRRRAATEMAAARAEMAEARALGGAGRPKQC